MIDWEWELLQKNIFSCIDFFCNQYSICCLSNCNKREFEWETWEHRNWNCRECVISNCIKDGRQYGKCVWFMSRWATEETEWIKVRWVDEKNWIKKRKEGIEKLSQFNYSSICNDLWI